MDATITALTLVVLPLPLLLAAGAARFRQPVLLAPAGFIAGLYVFVWLWMRPTCFVVGPAELQVVWPLRQRSYSLPEATTAEVVSRRSVRAEFGRAVRVGSGGLWGAFGWLWTSQGIVGMYISRLTGIVLVRRGTERPLLLSPKSPHAFVKVIEASRPT
jgi:hypothetical protein